VEDQQFAVTPIGRIESALIDPSLAPKQGDEGAPDAWLIMDAQFNEGLRDLHTGDHVIVLTWFHRARRDLLIVHPRDNPAAPTRGVFTTRSADRPNPIGLHRTEVLDIQGSRIRVRSLEAIDGTPIVDLKPVLDRTLER
jgi:tRNA-Thr(GGU) m(6)t(6)A37 methyltransferase TsaA